MNDHELAADLALRAGARLLALRDQAAIDVNDPAAAQALMATADAAANGWLLEELAQQRPDDAVLSEEAEDNFDRLQSQRVWIIDPVDGTFEFARRLPEFAVHVALWDVAAQSFAAGAVAVPNQSRVWSTLDQPLPSAVAAGRNLKIVVSPREPKPLVSRLRDELADYARDHGFGQVEIINCGSVGGKMHLLLAGVADVYVSSIGFYEWDAAAPTAVAQHHGIQVTELNGEPVPFNRKWPRVNSFVAARPELHALVLEALN